MDATAFTGIRIIDEVARRLPDNDVAVAPVARGRVAYLVNVYPRISHSFIHSEIEALEQAGLTVERFTIRRSPGGAADPAEAAEAARTSALLEGNIAGMAGAVLRALIARPVETLGVLAQAVRSGGPLIRSIAYFAEAAVLARQLRRRGIRHVHVHFGTNAVAVARLAARLAPITYSFTAHGPDEFDAPRSLDLHGKISDAAFAVAVSHFGRGQLMRWAAPRDWSRIHVVRCGVAPRFLSGEPVDVPVAPRLLCVARLSAQKGLPLLIEAASRVPRSIPFRLDIIGDGEDRAEIEQQIARLRLADRVVLLGWRTPEQVLSALQGARAFVLPSFAEGLPVVLMEALAAGRAVIATAIAGIPELVDPRSGWLVASGSAQMLADAMVEALAATPEELAAMGQAGRARVAALHDPDINAGKLAGLLQGYL